MTGSTETGAEEERAKPGPKPGSDGARRVAEAHQGSHPHDKRGGFAADKERAREAGRKGGEMVKRRYGAEFLREIGRTGGEATRDKRGEEFYSRIGRIGGIRRGENAAIKRELLPPQPPAPKRPRGRPRKERVGQIGREVAAAAQQGQQQGQA